MTAGTNFMTAGLRNSQQGDDLLLRETNHRCSNDLQLVVSLLALQSGRAQNPETREALHDAMERVAILARSRAAFQHQRSLGLREALRAICDALHSQTEPRGIVVSLDLEDEGHGLSQTQITTLALVVNELATNAIKHGFKDGKVGRVRISVQTSNNRMLVIIVDDDGLPLPDDSDSGTGLGLGLVRRLIASVGGLLIPPARGSKAFELRMPLPSPH